MRHLLSGIAIVGLLAALPAAAQTSSDQTKSPNAGTNSSTMAPGEHAKGDKAMSGTTSPGPGNAAELKTAPQSGAAEPSSGTSRAGAQKSGTSEPMHRAHAKRGGASPEDNMAEELNRQELQRVTHGNEAAGSTQAPSSMAHPPAAGQAPVGGTGGSTSK